MSNGNGNSHNDACLKTSNTALVLEKEASPLAYLEAPMSELVWPQTKKKPILLVEDDSIDVMTVKRAFKELNVLNPLTVVGNGNEALDYLNNQKNMPCLVLLDLNMPKMNGVEFLRVLRKDRQYKDIPVVVLTTSRGDQDRLDCRQLGASGYFVKPVEYREFCNVLDVVYRYWSLNEL